MRGIKRQVHYEAVRVIERLPDGRMRAWWPGDKLPTAKEAGAQAVANSKAHPGEYAVIRVTVDELPSTRKLRAATTTPDSITTQAQKDVLRALGGL